MVNDEEVLFDVATMRHFRETAEISNIDIAAF